MRKLSMAFSLLFAACSSSPTTNDGGDGGEPEGSIPINEGGACSIEKSPKDDKCTIDEAYGVFVSDSLGSAMGDGSRTKPLKTIQAGIDLAKSPSKNVYVCAEQYRNNSPSRKALRFTATSIAPWVGASSPSAPS